MRPSVTVSVPIVVLAWLLAGCLRHGVPIDTTVEHTALAAPMPATPPTARHPARVVTYNVHMIDGAAIARAIRRDPQVKDADVIVLEEVPQRGPCSAACDAAQRLGMYAAFAPGHAVGRGSIGVAVLSRQPLRFDRVIELPGYDVHLNTGRRVALAVQTTIGDTPLWIYAVHLENRITPAQRRRQMDPVLLDAALRDEPVLIAGDLNTSPFTWAWHLLPLPVGGKQAHAVEARARTLGFATPVTGSGATSKWLGMRLDAIYTRQLAVIDYGVAEAVRASDHLPLWADVVPDGP